MNFSCCLRVNLNLYLNQFRQISTSQPMCWLEHMSRLRVVDNSAIGKQAMLEGKPPKVIGVYTKNGIAHVGDKVIVAIKGQKKRGYIVGCVQKQKPMIPKFDSNNIVLIEDNGNPTGTRVVVPIPNYLRSKGPELNKIIAIATRFI